MPLHLSILKRASTSLFYALPDPLQKIGRLWYLKVRGWANLREARRVAGPLPTPSNDRKILFTNLRFWPTHHAWESVLAAALQKRGHPVEFLICDSCFTICDYRAGGKMDEKACGMCATHSRQFLDAIGLPARAASRYIGYPGADPVTDRSVSEFRAVAVEGLPLGELCYPSLCRYLAIGNVPDTAANRDLYRQFLEGAVRLARGAAPLLDEGWHAIVMMNGKFFAERILFEMARQRNIPVLTYERGRLNSTMVFSWNGFANDAFNEDAWAEARETPLTPAQDRQLDDYLEDRVYGRRSMTDPWNLCVRGEAVVRGALGLSPDKPLFVLFTNLLWDTSILGKDLGFPSHGDWILRTIEWAEKRPDLQLVVRVHPAETRLRNLPTQERIMDLLSKRWPNLPPNVLYVGPDSEVSSYTLMELADLALVYATNAGLEAVLKGTPAVCAALSHYYGKGIACDAPTAEAYFAALEGWKSLNPSIAVARRYAFFFFFQYMVPFEPVQEIFRGDFAGRDFKFAFDSIQALLDREPPSLRFVADRISERRPIYWQP